MKTSLAPLARILPQWFFLLLLTVMLSGCGFQLKQSPQLPAGFGPASIEGVNQFSDLYKAIARKLKQSSIQLATEKNLANNRIVIRKVENKKRVLSVGTDIKVSEYELTKSLRFMVLDMTGNQVIEPQTISTSSSYSVSSTDVLGKGLEENDIHRRMEENLVDRMFLSISSQSR